MYILTIFLSYYFRSAGKQQCVDGTDEDYCEQLLLNQCDPHTEYRCRNGMCIDQEYFLDGNIDCQDRSDEQLDLRLSLLNWCPMLPNMDCDEYLPMAKKYFSCGDGQEIVERVILQRDVFGDLDHSCYAFRDKQWMCELDSRQIMWTNPNNGHCLDFVDKETFIDDESTNCNFIHKCALALAGKHYLCPCAGNECKAFFNIYCGSNNDSSFQYPDGPILTPFVVTIYQTDKHDFDRNHWPDIFQFTRSIKCNTGVSALPSTYTWIDYQTLMLTFAKQIYWHPFETSFCVLHHAQHNKSDGELTYGNCWNDSYPNQARHCPTMAPFSCISKYHVKDGVEDCPFGKQSSKESHYFDTYERNITFARDYS